MPLKLSPHIMQKEPGTRRDRIVKVIPYVRINNGDGPNIFLQQGKAYSEGGQEIKKSDYPVWFYDELNKLSENALNECGWTNKAKKEIPVEPKVPVKEASEAPVKKIGRPRGSKNKKRKRVTRKVESVRPEVSNTDGDSSSSRSVDI